MSILSGVDCLVICPSSIGESYSDVSPSSMTSSSTLVIVWTGVL